MKVAVVGANGQLGSDLVAIFRQNDHEVVELHHDHIQVENQDSVSAVMSEIRPDAILNTAAFHNVPMCESDPDSAFAVNAQGALHMARAAADLDAINVYFSTDYVFSGVSSNVSSGDSSGHLSGEPTPYIEADLPAPLNVYGASKLAGEHLTTSYCERGFVVRISGIYGRVACRAKGENFVTKMIRLAAERPDVRVVTDEILTPTPTLDIARASLDLIKSDAYGLYHLTCEGACSWYDFAREIFDVLSFDTPLYKASVADFPSPVRRPFYSVLDNQRWNALGMRPMRHWRDALHDYLAATQKSKSARI